MAPIGFMINEAFQSMTLAWGNIRPLLSSLRVSQCLIQAIPPAPSSSPLLQLPFFTTALCHHIVQKTDANSTATLHPFLGLPDSKRRSLTIGSSSPLLTELQYKTAMSVASQLPAPRLERAFFKVVGERHLTPGCLVQFIIKLRFIPPTISTTNIPAPDPSDLEEPDPKEGDLEALRGKRRKKITDPKSGASKTVYAEDDKIQPPLAHAPYFARDHAPRWRVFLADTRQAKVAVPPFTFATFDQPIFEKDERGLLTDRPTYKMQTLRMQFQAPPQVGDYQFTCWTVCDSYIGCDFATDVVMRIEEASKAEDVLEEEEVSEPEEGEFPCWHLCVSEFANGVVLDSLAGQMAAMKGGNVKKSKVRAEEDEDDESSSEEEESETDTDTDTDSDGD